MDPQGKDVPLGEVGEIVGRVPTATAGYFKNEERTREVFRNGWVHTGDLGRFDEEGFLCLSGRLKDMIISGGQNVFSLEVENSLLSHPAVADCAVIGLPDDLWGEMVTAAENTHGKDHEICPGREILQTVTGSLPNQDSHPDFLGALKRGATDGSAFLSSLEI